MRNLPYGFDIYLVNVKTIRQIAQIFVAFSEKLNFMAKVLLKRFAILHCHGLVIISLFVHHVLEPFESKVSKVYGLSFV